MTIKWVKVDPLVMRGEPFCYNTRLTVRQLLELRRDGHDVSQLLREHPELRVVGIAHAYRYAAEHRDVYAEFFGEAKPARATVVTGFAVPGIHVEIEAVAYRPR